MSNFLQMRDSLRIFTMGGLGKTLQPGDVYGQLINRAQRDLAEDWEWSFRRTNTIVNTVAPKTAGSITVATGSPVVIGTGTHFTLADKGAFLWVGGVGTTPLPIADVQGTQMLNLTSPFAGPTLTNTTYRLAPLFYLVEGAQEILSVISNDVYLDKRLREEINWLDPCRTDQGGAPSYIWAEAPHSPDGSLMMEMWPTPSDARAYLVEFFRGAPLLENDVDIPILQSTLIEEKAMITCCEMMYASTGQSTWLALRDKHQANLDGGLDPPGGKLGQALNRDAARQQYLGRVKKPRPFLQGYDSGFTPLHTVIGD